MVFFDRFGEIDACEIEGNTVARQPRFSAFEFLASAAIKFPICSILLSTVNLCPENPLPSSRCLSADFWTARPTYGAIFFTQELHDVNLPVDRFKKDRYLESLSSRKVSSAE